MQDLSPELQSESLVKARILHRREIPRTQARSDQSVSCQITSPITSSAVREMKLKKGQTAAALIKATEVMIIRV